MNTDQAKHHGVKRKPTLLASLVSFVGILSTALLASFFMDYGISRAAANFEEDEDVDPEEKTEAGAPIENSHPFDKVFRHTRSGHPDCLCFVFTTREGLSNHDCDMLLVEHASAALEFADSFGEHDEPYLFLFYLSPYQDSNMADSNMAPGIAINTDLLQEIADAPRSEAGRLLSAHQWVTFCRIPEPDEAEVSDEAEDQP